MQSDDDIEIIHSHQEFLKLQRQLIDLQKKNNILLEQQSKTQDQIKERDKKLQTLASIAQNDSKYLQQIKDRDLINIRLVQKQLDDQKSIDNLKAQASDIQAKLKIQFEALNENLKTELEGQKKAKHEIQIEKEQLEIQLQELSNKCIQQDSQITGLKKAISDEYKIRETEQNTISQLQLKMANLEAQHQKQIQQHEQSIKEWMEKENINAEKMNEYIAFKEQIALLQSSNSQIETELSQAREEIHKSSIRLQSVQQQQNDEYLRVNTELQNRILSLNKQLEEHSQKVASLEKEHKKQLSAQQIKQKSLRESVLKQEEKLNKYREQREQCMQQIEIYKQQLSEEQYKYQKLISINQYNEKTVCQRQTEIDGLKEQLAVQTQAAKIAEAQALIKKGTKVTNLDKKRIKKEKSDESEIVFKTQETEKKDKKVKKEKQSESQVQTRNQILNNQLEMEKAKYTDLEIQLKIVINDLEFEKERTKILEQFLNESKQQLSSVSEILKSITEGHILETLDNIMGILGGKLKDLEVKEEYEKYINHKLRQSLISDINDRFKYLIEEGKRYKLDIKFEMKYIN